MEINMNWAALGVGALIAFLLGWLLFGLLGAIILAIVVLLLTGILRIRF